MKRLGSRLTWWRHTLPKKSTSAVDATEEERRTMKHFGIDIHKNESQICILAEGRRGLGSRPGPAVRLLGTLQNGTPLAVARRWSGRRRVLVA